MNSRTAREVFSNIRETLVQILQLQNALPPRFVSIDLLLERMSDQKFQMSALINLCVDALSECCDLPFTLQNKLQQLAGKGYSADLARTLAEVEARCYPKMKKTA